MPVQISRATVQKLTHESPEIRRRTLDQIEAKVMRALAHNERIDFRPGQLFKQLIRWFGLQPLQCEQQVLVFMLRLLRSAYAQQAITQLGVERYKREMGKVQQLLRGQNTALQLVEQILEHLADYAREQQATEETLCGRLESALTISGTTTTLSSSRESANVCDTDRTNTNASTFAPASPPPNERDGFSFLCAAQSIADDDYELPWSQPAAADFNALRMLADVLTNTQASGEELQQALQHLQLTLLDYPPEYLLQAPHVLRKLALLLERLQDNKEQPQKQQHHVEEEQQQQLTSDIFELLLVFMRVLQQRLKQRAQCANYAPPLNSRPSSSMAHTQLKMSCALHLLLRLCLQHCDLNIYTMHAETPQVLLLVQQLLQLCAQQHFKIDAETIAAIIKICAKLGTAIAEAEHFTLLRIKQLILLFQLQQLLSSQERDKQQALLVTAAPQLQQLLYDYALAACYPQRYEALQSLLETHQTQLTQQRFQWAHIEREIQLAIRLLKPTTNAAATTRSNTTSTKGNITSAKSNITSTKNSITSTIISSKTTPTCAAAILRQSTTLHLSLTLLQSARLLQLLFDAINSCLPLYSTNRELRCYAEQLLLKLLSLPLEAPHAALPFKLLAAAFKQHFGSLMSGDVAYCHQSQRLCNQQLLSAQIIGVPLSAPLLMWLTQQLDVAAASQNVAKDAAKDIANNVANHFANIICAAAANNAAHDAADEAANEAANIASINTTNNTPQISESCEKLLVLLLQSQHLMGGCHWQPLLQQLLLPALPLLQCCVFSAKINTQLLALGEPDARALPLLPLLQLNARFLFHPEARLRSEALTRICYALQQLPTAAQYMPNIAQISDVLPQDICVLQQPRDYARIFVPTTTTTTQRNNLNNDNSSEHDNNSYDYLHAASQQFTATETAQNEEALNTLQHLLTLLDSADVQPLIRNSALRQLNILCERWCVADAICRADAFYFALDALEQSLRCDSATTYADSALPALGILCKLLFCDATFRLELAGCANVYALLLRALFLYVNDAQARLDATLCLFLLLFADFLVVCGTAAVQAPALLRHLVLPLQLELRAPANVAADAATNLNNMFTSVADKQCALRQLIAACCSCDVAECDAVATKASYALLNQQFVQQQSLLYDFDGSLYFTQRDCRLLKASNPLQNMRRFIKAMSNATSHAALMNACSSLQLQLLCVDFASPLELPAGDAQLLLSLLDKYLQLAPANAADFALYAQLLELLSLCLRLDVLGALTRGFFRHLQADYQHAAVQLLLRVEDEEAAATTQDEEVAQKPLMSVRFFRLLCTTLHQLLAQAANAQSDEAVYESKSGSSSNTNDTNSSNKQRARNKNNIKNTKNNNVICSINNNNHVNSSQRDTAFAIFCCNLFELLFERAHQLFAARDLQRARCLLALLRQLSAACSTLPLADEQLLHYIKRCFNYSVALKSFTQTGAQWQRDCLQLVCQLTALLSRPQRIFTLNASCIKYLSGMCGHSDAQVRALAWCILAQQSRYEGVADIEEAEEAAARKSKQPKQTASAEKLTPYLKRLPAGVALLVNELAYLPGGLLACCLSTLLDYAEIALVRTLAGNLFVELLHKSADFEQATLLLQQQTFWRAALEALNCCQIAEQLPPSYDYNVAAADNNCFTTCAIISCFCHICMELLVLAPPDYVHELCASHFMQRLSELLRAPLQNRVQLKMCADICQLYAMCYEHNFSFLQRHLCRDRLWLQHFCALFEFEFAQTLDLVNVLQLLLVLCKDSIGFHYICAHFAQNPTHIVRLFLTALRLPLLNSALQRCTLAVLSFLLIKSQVEDEEQQNEYITFAQLLEQPVNAMLPALSLEDLSRDKENVPGNGCDREMNTKAVSAKHTNAACSNALKNVALNSARSSCDSAKNTQPSELTNSARLSVASANQNLDQEHQPAAAALLFDALQRLFAQLYPLKACKFETAPTAARIQICETLTVLLKVCSAAQTVAQQRRFLEQLLRIFENFLHELDNMPCSTFVRRYGESRKQAVIAHMQLLFNVLLNWHASPNVVLTHESHVALFTQLLLLLWPWVLQAASLRQLVLQMCAILSERSLPVCKQFSGPQNAPHSLLQLTLKVATQETLKVRAVASNTSTASSTSASSSNQYETPTICAALRVLMHCCACVEGRQALLKARVLDIFDSMSPFNVKAPKQKLEVVLAWLQFWELFTRHTDCAQARNVTSLCKVITMSAERCCQLRLLSLRILRNMCFAPVNRTQLIACNEFIYMAHEIIATSFEDTTAVADVSYEEQLIVAVSLWQLISGGVKYVAMLRGTKLARKMRVLREHLQAVAAASTGNDDAKKLKAPFAQQLLEVLDVIFCIFQN